MRRLILLLSIALTACSGEDAVSRDYPCQFVFDISLHPMPCHLTGILGNPGHFCTVSSQQEQGIRHVKTIRNYDGATDDIPFTTAKEKQLAYYLGANNAIIIGTSSYDSQLVAYDGQCPNCLAERSGTRHPLTWQKGGQQLCCADCQRTYDVNNGVVTSDGGGRQLLVYRAAFDGQLLRAWN